MKVGTLVKLKVPCLDNTPGTWGVCFNEYDLGEGPAGQVIFENGEYDGFSPKEQEDFLDIIMETTYAYTFTNVMQLSLDFEKGKFEYLKFIAHLDRQGGLDFAKVAIAGQQLIRKGKSNESES